jgi:hypothetical protein
VHPITFSLQFRGQVTRLGDGLRKEARAPGWALVTRLTRDGPAARFEWASGEDEALLESTLTFQDERRFDEEGMIPALAAGSCRARTRSSVMEAWSG